MSRVPESVRREALSRDFKASVRIGKSGISESLVEEIDGQLKTRTLVKIKVNKGLFDKKGLEQAWAYLSSQTNSILVLARGNVGVLWRK